MIKFLFPVLLFFSISSSVVIAQEESLKPIPIYSYNNNTQPIFFPQYIKEISPVVKKMIRGEFKEAKENKIIFREIHSSVLQDLQECISEIPKATYNTHGELVPPEKIDSNTIIIHSLLEDALKEKLSKQTNHRLKQLFLSAHFLQIDSLIDAFSYFIAKRIEQKTHTARSQSEMDKYMEMQWYGLSEDHFPYINELLYLTKHGKRKRSIADYIGLYGQPFTYDNLINLRKMEITSLQGIERIENKDMVKTIRLNDNFILDATIDPYFPQKPFQHFPNLITLDLSGSPLKVYPATSLSPSYVQKKRPKH